jgi:hypothetical protein
MPLGPFEREVLRTIAANRNPDSFVAGATVLHQANDSPRLSRDVDLFHDAVASVAASVSADTAALQQAGFEVELEPERETFRRAILKKAGRQTKIEWVFDSAFRFFPVEADADLGWKLNFWDAATNKVLALAGRSELRDCLDLVFLHQRHLRLGALVWAAVGKDPGFTPESLVDWMRRHAVFRPDDLLALTTTSPVNLHILKKDWLEASESALELILRLPMEEAGCLYLDSHGRPVCPDPGSPEFSRLTRHFASVKGAWPEIVEE